MRGREIPQQLIYSHGWWPFWKTSSLRDYFPQLLMYQDFWSIGVQIKGILLWLVILKWRTQPNISVKFHVPVPLLVTQYLCHIYPSKSIVIHIPWFCTVILANNILLNTPLICSRSLRFVRWTEEKFTKWSYIIAMHLNKHTGTLLKMKTKILCTEIIIYFFLKVWRAGKYTVGVN